MSTTPPASLNARTCVSAGPRDYGHSHSISAFVVTGQTREALCLLLAAHADSRLPCPHTLRNIAIG
jgi:hypothetical protein